VTGRRKRREILHTKGVLSLLQDKIFWEKQPVNVLHPSATLWIETWELSQKFLIVLQLCRHVIYPPRHIAHHVVFHTTSQSEGSELSCVCQTTEDSFPGCCQLQLRQPKLLTVRKASFMTQYSLGIENSTRQK
jgi:hypothetical protein